MISSYKTACWCIYMFIHMSGRFVEIIKVLRMIGIAFWVTFISSVQVFTLCQVFISCTNAFTEITQIFFKSTVYWDFPGGPVVKTPHFQCMGYRFDPWLKNQEPTCHRVQPK